MSHFLRYFRKKSHAKDAVEDARQTIRSQHELVKIHYELWLSRLQKTEKKYARLVEKKASHRKINGLQAKLEKQKRKVLFWEQHLENHTFPPVIFGGRKAFFARCKGLISKEEWQEARNGRLCSRGDATKKGNPNGNPASFQWIVDGQLQDAPTDKRENLIGNLTKQVVLKALEKGCALVVEDLKFVHDQEVSAKFHRISHSFCYRKMLQAIERNCKRYGVELIQVHPAFTSVIGRLKYQPQYRINVHQSAALVIGRRGQRLNHEKVPTVLVKLCIKNNKRQNFCHLNNWKKWSAIKKSLTKILKQKGGNLVSWLDHRKELFETIS